MSVDYKNETYLIYKQKTDELLTTLPPFCTKARNERSLRLTEKTQYDYAYKMSIFLNYLHENNLSASPQNRIMLDTSVIALVESGMGLSILPEFVLQKYPGNYHALPLHSNIYRTIHLCTLKTKRPTLACRKMIQVIRDVVAAVPAKKV